MAAHADETDDSHPASLTHPGCAVVPAALAMAEREGASGVAIVRAVALGYDVCARIVMSIGYERLIGQARSTHAIGGLFGAAVAAGALAGFGETEMRYLLTYAVQQASGTMCWFGDRGHIEKAFDFGGMPARNGVAAATMVAAGFTAAADPFFGPKNFFDAFAPGADGAEIARDLGTRFEICNTNVKRWAVGSPNQAVLDALEAMLNEQPVTADDVDRIEIELAANAVAVVDNRDMPGVCLQYLVGAMLVDGTLTFASAHDVDRMRDPRIRRLWDRTTIVPSLELQAQLPRRGAVARIRMRDGNVLEKSVDMVRGTVENPMSDGELNAKATDLMAPVLGTDRTAEIVDAVWRLAELPDVRQFIHMAKPGFVSQT
jgi:2-methylcitrate dehydratase PrpD